MDELTELLTVVQQFGGGGWVIAIIFLWMLRHDILKPIGKKIEHFDHYFDRLIAAIEQRGE